MTSHYVSIDGIGSPVYDPSTGGHHGRGLPLQASAALPRSPPYSPHPSVGGAVPSLASPYSAGAGAGGYSSTSGPAAAAAAMSSSSSAAAVAAVDSLLKRDKDAIYRRAAPRDNR